MTIPSKPMVFRDEDLKRLKVHLEADKEFHENATWVEHVHMDALLHRLDCAEAVLEAIDVNDGWCAQAERMLSYWRKSKGA